MATSADVFASWQRIAPYVHRTPVMTCATLDAMAGRKLVFKCENFQKVGAFKFRGACNAVMKLPHDVAARGVVTHSSGNHAQALALAAKLRGIAAHIVMPKTASPVKKRAVEGYGAHVCECEPNQQSRERTAAGIVHETGGTLIPPYDHPDIIAGQGTAALELLQEAPDVQAIVAPIGGGGLMSGTCLAARLVRASSAPRASGESIRLFAAEPAGADDAARSMAAGELQPEVSPPHTIADGLLTSMSELTWSIIREHVERVLTVTDDEIVAAMRLVWERMKIVIEPSAAVAVAVVLGEAFRALAGLERVGVILSGGNVDLDRLPWVAAR